MTVLRRSKRINPSANRRSSPRLSRSTNNASHVPKKRNNKSKTLKLKEARKKHEKDIMNQNVSEKMDFKVLRSGRIVIMKKKGENNTQCLHKKSSSCTDMNEKCPRSMLKKKEVDMRSLSQESTSKAQHDESTPPRQTRKNENEKEITSPPQTPFAVPPAPLGLSPGSCYPFGLISPFGFYHPGSPYNFNSASTLGLCHPGPHHPSFGWAPPPPPKGLFPNSLLGHPFNVSPHAFGCGPNPGCLDGLAHLGLGHGPAPSYPLTPPGLDPGHQASEVRIG